MQVTAVDVGSLDASVGAGLTDLDSTVDVSGAGEDGVGVIDELPVQPASSATAAPKVRIGATRLNINATYWMFRPAV